MTEAASKPAKMTVDQFIDWSMRQPRGRYELVDGEIVAMAAEGVRHNLAKAAVYMALKAAIDKADLPCTVFTGGMTVRIDEHHAREPDAAVQRGAVPDPDAVALDSPLIVIEVISPSSESDDMIDKLVEYFSVPSVMHYVIVNPKTNVVIHHARGEPIATRILRDGDIAFDPPGFGVAVRDMFAGE